MKTKTKMAKLPEPVIEEWGNILVVRDDLVPGGTKRRVIPYVLSDAEEFVYASPAYGYAQIALAHACRDLGRKATVFIAQRRVLHERTERAVAAGAEIKMVPMGFLSNVEAKARAYALEKGAELLPCGFDTEEFGARLTRLAQSLPVDPPEVWSVASSGTLTRALQAAWPKARFYAVRVGMKNSDVGRATVFTAPEKFEQDARVKPPFPSCSNYDAKAWRFILEHARPGALFWNVAA